ncbi:2,3-dimethylmalate lyase [Rhodovastum atsumiense]|uniref:Oxaloacetate decarboxylase n=1 Tax=Rhodovastum atsumiense TaxID=504468 RepID=A0A5M6ISC4_9PROT|nr:oxaloacetate decarboxylase [Rhodovastum atsumiense]KAA5611210.1 oxaloacetate decarboxylase [Rhodovastum atsumiense]CAH2602480.1 2,3-dimethylmalate lyase [Rhodovastum atsumiense]
MNRSARFRSLIRAPEILQLPCCHDGLSARVLEQAGFEAIGCAGYGLSGSLLGMPDISVLSGHEMVGQYRNVCALVNIPVFVDIDTGFGDVNNVIRVVRECEKAGAAGLFIEDQTYPKRCGHMAGKSVVTVEEYLPKLKAALWARENPDFVITARSDALAVHGIEEALYRARLYAGTGADMVFVEAVHTTEEMKAVNATLAALDTPSMANMIEGGQTPLLGAAELQQLGYSVVAYPCGSVFTAVKALREWAAHLKRHGTSTEFLPHMLSFDAYFEFIGAQAIRDREKTFL